MKHLLLLLALCLIVGSVSATVIDFQNGNKSALCYNGGSATSCTLVTNMSGGNSFMITPGTNQQFMVLSNPSPMTYAAGTVLNPPGYGPGTNGGSIQLYDASMNNMYDSRDITGGYGTGRVEVNIVGGIAYVYFNGILQSQSGVLGTNPSYIGLGRYFAAHSAYWDDAIWGSTEDRTVLDMPQSNAYYLKKDFINPGASGLYNATTDILTSSTYLETSWSRSNLSGLSLINDSIYLIHVDTGTVYSTHYTGTRTYGTEYWNIQDALVTVNAPYGRYRLKLNNTYSDEIAYIANGANIAFDKDEYSQQDQATITYLIDGEYWDTSTYTYSMKIYEGNTWNVVDTQAVSASSGTFTYTFTDSNPQGEYYAVIGTTPNAGGDFIWMRYDYAALEAYVKFLGYVNTAQNATAISGANVSFTQNGLVSNSFSGIDGNYTADGFLTGAVLTINVTAPSHSQYLATLTPMVAKSISLNITLNSTTPTYTGLGIGGVIRDGIFSGGTITKGYGRPIPAAATYLRNVTYGESCTDTSNNAGWYLFDESNCMLTTGRLYDIWSEKIGYSNSPNYTAVAA